MYKRWIILALIFTSTLKAQQVVQVFTTDYCTGYAEGTFHNPNQWAHCCLQHDLFFWAGGTYQHRLLADQKLKECVQATGSWGHANLIYLGVSLGRISPIKIKNKQWGNAWGKEVRKTNLSLVEIKLLQKSLESNPLISVHTQNEFIHDLEELNPTNLLPTFW